MTNIKIAERTLQVLIAIVAGITLGHVIAAVQNKDERLEYANEQSRNIYH